LPRIHPVCWAGTGWALAPVFIYLVEDDGDYRHYLADGRQIYYLPGVELYESQAHELELAELGALPLAVPRELQRPASTGE
jgi:hypothetical protein